MAEAKQSGWPRGKDGDGAKRTEKKSQKKVGAESLNTLSDDVKTCLICFWKELVQQLQGILGESGSHKACRCVSETGPLGF